ALTSQQQRWRQRAEEELLEGWRYDGDQAHAHLAAGIYHERRGDVRKAIDAYRLGIRVQPSAVGPRSNLAALLEQLRQTSEAQQLRREELPLLARDADYAPD